MNTNTGEIYKLRRCPHFGIKNSEFFWHLDMSIQSSFKHPWWYPFDYYGFKARYLDDWLIHDLSHTVRQKPEWEAKFRQKEIAEKWRLEFVAQKPETKYPNEVFDYMLRELEWYENLQSQPEVAKAGFKFGPNDMIMYSDKAISDETAKRFAKYANSFEQSLPLKDYHPGSDDLVVDLVHPSLFHLVYGRTKALKDGKLETVEFVDEIWKVKKRVADYGISKKFQWLPAIMKLDPETKKYDFTSYINNLHPVKHAELYKSIAAIFNLVIPGLNLSLSRFQSDEYLRIAPASFQGFYEKEFVDWQRNEIDRLMKEEPANQDWDKFNEEQKQKKRECYRKFPPKYEKDPETKPFELRNFEQHKIIVKLANIELTPEKPEYKGGSWHVEGTINEDIVATVLYYYDVENIEESKLSFKSGFEDPEYEQDDKDCCMDFFGLKDGDTMSRYIGNVKAEQGRVTIFPNCFQHHVDAFSLKDKTKPGHRKILCFFFVEPRNNVLKATDIVPPQNEAWVNDKSLMDKYFPGIDTSEITTMTEEEAKEFREGLMTERKVIHDDEDNTFIREFSLCEH